MIVRVVGFSDSIEGIPAASKSLLDSIDSMKYDRVDQVLSDRNLYLLL